MSGLDKHYRKLCAQQENLRLDHNEQGLNFREGKITKKEWQKYLKMDFEPKSRIIEKGIASTRRTLITKFNFKIQPLTDAETAYPAQINTDEKRMHYLLVLEHVAVNDNMDNPLLNDVNEKISALKRKFINGS